MEKLNGLDLFSGIGGNTLALEPWVRTVAYCEQDRHAQSVLLSRMADGRIPRTPICDDITELDGRELRGSVDIIIAGFPCQDISVAGKGAGLEGKRSGLFFEICRLAQEIEPTFLFLENVPAIRTRGLREVIRALSDLGYDCRWTTLSAAETGAPHKRERWFLLGHAKGKRESGGLRDLHQEDERQRGSEIKHQDETEYPGDAGKHARVLSDPERLELRDESRRGSGESGRATALPGDNGSKESLANTERSGNGAEPRAMVRETESRESDEAMSLGSRSAIESVSGFRRDSMSNGWWGVEPDVGRVAHGVPLRVDRIKRLGNAVVPIQAREAFKELMGIRC